MWERNSYKEQFLLEPHRHHHHHGKLDKAPLSGGHDFELPTIKYKFNKLNFIVRSLFNYV